MVWCTNFNREAPVRQSWNVQLLRFAWVIHWQDYQNFREPTGRSHVITPRTDVVDLGESPIFEIRDIATVYSRYCHAGLGLAREESLSFLHLILKLFCMNCNSVQWPRTPVQWSPVRCYSCVIKWKQTLEICLPGNEKEKPIARLKWNENCSTTRCVRPPARTRKGCQAGVGGNGIKTYLKPCATVVHSRNPESSNASPPPRPGKYLPLYQVYIKVVRSARLETTSFVVIRR